MRSTLVSALIVIAAMFAANSAFAGNYVRVSPDLEIYYEEAGSGRPIIFIPGWTGTTVYMRQQVAHFSKRYRAIVYDPRSQGRSSKTLENNTYTQHGHDLKALMDALKIKDAVLVGHSWGCHDAYAYFRAYGTDNVKAYVCLDQSPKDIIEKEGDWGSLKTFADLTGFYQGIAYDRLKTTQEFLKGMATRPLKQDEINSFSDELLKTPTYAAVSLMLDGDAADYTPEAKAIEAKIPVLNVVADPGWFPGWAQAAQSWGKSVATRTEVVVLPGLHLMHWESPDKINAVLDKFLEKVK
jgi:pimeloyl-ACP methyl ester carboxylesterase